MLIFLRKSNINIVTGELKMKKINVRSGLQNNPQ